jgi:hypothetical protein
MDYVEALMAVAESLSDIRRRLIALEAQVASYDGDTPSVEALVERIESLEDYDWQTSWESEVDSLIEAAIENIDWSDHVKEALNDISFTVTVD